MWEVPAGLSRLGSTFKEKMMNIEVSFVDYLDAPADEVKSFIKKATEAVKVLLQHRGRYIAAENIVLEANFPNAGIHRPRQYVYWNKFKIGKGAWVWRGFCKTEAEDPDEVRIEVSFEDVRLYFDHEMTTCRSL
jgi:hypothetical protein